MGVIRHLLIATAAAALLWPISQSSLHKYYPLRLYSKEGILLREFRNAEGAYGSTLALEKYPPDLIRAVIAAEDAGFLTHNGIDAGAMLRAAADNLRHGRIRSGASTITQQLARMLYADLMPANRFGRKIIESMISIKISLMTPKPVVLEAYLNQVPMPLNSAGIAGASERIFGKHVGLLSDEETVALATMISRRQFTNPSFEHGFHKLWRRLYPDRPADFAGLKKQLMAVKVPHDRVTRGSEHFVDWLRENNLSAQGEIRSEISANAGQRISAIIRNEIEAVKDAGAEHAAVVVLEKTDDADLLRAMVGSADFNSDVAGELNHAVRVRSAGSTLKPFVYALGFEKNFFNAQTMFSDSELTLPTGRENETYRPHNNDMRFWGNLTLRESLISSRNIPAIAAAQQIGLENLLAFLRRGGMAHLSHSAEYYGPGLAIGSGGATVVELARLYSAIASGGILRAVKFGEQDGREMHVGETLRLMSPSTAGRLTHMLSERTLRRRAFGARNFLDFPFPVAAKTGTSKDYRDGWVAGFTPQYVVAVWVGNSRGIPMRQVSGAWGAGRIFHQVMRYVNGDSRHQFSYPDKLSEIRICRRSGKLARPSCPAHSEMLMRGETTPALCPFRHAPEESAVDGEQPIVVSPAAGERYILHPNEAAARQEIPVVIRYSGPEKFAYAVGNEPPRPFSGSVRDFRRLTGGDYTLRILSAGEVVDEVNFSVR